MTPRTIVDSGFLVALLEADDVHHAWARKVATQVRGPWLTSEACITEVVFMLQQVGRVAVERLFEWLDTGSLHSRHLLPEELEPVRAELLRYADRWVDFADACIVCMSDFQPKLPVVTVDTRDFAVYFRNRRGRRLLAPPQR
jgi:predicted nucleic acid-binding protein